MSQLLQFLDSAVVSIKICGVTRHEDAERLVDMGVDALGVNFWPGSKRHLAVESAGWLKELAGRILRIGVFVNSEADLPIHLVREGLLDVVQLHGDEAPEQGGIYRKEDVPFIKAIGVRSSDDLSQAADFHATAILLDAHAPGVYGGTGETFDWSAALDFRDRYPEIPTILAGGITVENAARACAIVRPAALDVASGAEHSPGVKDFGKVAALLAELERG